MVVPLHKHIEALSPRLQIIQDNNNNTTNTHNHATQLIAIFQNFPLGRCMNFSLKGTDVFEAFARGGRFYVRFVDAKFSLPKGGKAAEAEFLCLDVLEYGTEHADIVVGFESEAGALHLFPCLSAIPSPLLPSAPRPPPPVLRLWER